MNAAGTSGTTGPNLDKELTADPPSATRESIVDPNKQIAPGYPPNIMPPNFGQTLTPKQIDDLVAFLLKR